MAPLLANASRIVPAGARARVRVLATAGMRLLPPERQRPVWNEVRAALRRHTNFTFEAHDVRTLSGNYEGLYHWMAIRHIIGDAAPNHLGGLDLGGASSQIAFSPAADGGGIMQDAYVVAEDASAAGKDSPARVYSHSYMRFGQEQAQLRLAGRLEAAADAAVAGTAVAGAGAGANAATSVPMRPVNNPCFLRGYARNVSLGCDGQDRGKCRARLLVGTGNWSLCREAVTPLLHREYECVLPPCAVMGEYSPNVSGVQFFASAFFFYVANGLGLVARDGRWDGTWRDIELAGRRYCERPWSDVSSNKYAANYCFGSAFVPALLEAYAIPADSTAVAYVRRMRGFEVAWALGAMLFHIGEPDAHEQSCSRIIQPGHAGDVQVAGPATSAPSAVREWRDDANGWAESSRFVVVVTVAIVAVALLASARRKVPTAILV